jgi:ParB family protein of integrating conjugative element (PFGI_1 class)
MVSKKQTAEQVKNVLGVGYFENQREVQDNDPIEVVSMKIPIDNIQKYDRNPRQSRNPEYNTLLELLRANGQEEALTITRRPGDEHYIIRRGGNTRLDIMTLLYHETGDERFEIIDCLFMPWTVESDCIVGHLNENTSQGRMTLIDKARGYRHFKQEYEKEHGIDALGLRKLAALLKDKGSPVNHGSLGVMNYALDILEAAIPETLARGLGKSQIEKLKRIDQTFQRLAEVHDLYDAETRDQQIKAEFHQLLSDHDGDEWDMELVLHEFSQRLGRLLDKVPYNRLKFDIDECLKRDPWKVDLMSTLQDDPAPVMNQEQNDDSSVLDETQISATQPTSGPPSTTHQRENNSVQAPCQKKENPKQEEPVKTTKQASNLPPTSERQITLPDNAFTAGEFDLKSMRSRICTLALQFAQSTQLRHCVVNWNYGYGYFLDLPKSRFGKIMEEEQSKLPDWDHKIVTNRFSKDRDDITRIFAWWLLWQTQGILDTQSDDPVPGFKFMPESMMRNLINQLYNPEDNRAFTLMTSAVGKISMHMGGSEHMADMALAYSYIRPASMMKYITLLEAKTQFQAYVEANNIDLWMEV